VKYNAIVFDLDGVLWDGEPLYHHAFDVVLEPYGVTVTAEEYVAVIGSSVEAAWQHVLNIKHIDEPVAKFLQPYDHAVMQLLADPIEPLPGAAEVLRELNARDIPVGLASASLRNWIDATLAGLGLIGEFRTTVAANEVAHAKPAPDLYLTAAKNLGVDPKVCVAVEDTLFGVHSAKAAGMYTIQLRAASTALAPLDEADAVIESYSQFDFTLFAD
jgi:HAD superfamily hydrolase (TIGR01509 family)